MSSVTATREVQTFNRFELKYLVHHARAWELARRIRAHVLEDRNAGPEPFYKVVSRYYDSPDLACYWEKLDGEKYRRKVRVRTYGTHPEDAFLEIKQRHNLNVQKRRLRAPLEEVESRMQEIQRGQYRGDAHPVYDEVFLLRHRYHLRPTLVVSYNRTAFVDRYHRRLRVTFDRNVRCRNLDLSLDARRHLGLLAIRPDFVIVEIKFNHAVPRWLCTCLNALDLQIERVSKYCYGIERLRLAEPGPGR